MAHKSDAEYAQQPLNIARFFVEHPQISWVIMFAVLLWGIYSYLHMPQRKDPEIPVRMAQIICPWPGMVTKRVEQLVTRKIELKVAENTHIQKIESTSKVGLSVINVELDDKVRDTAKQFDDIKYRLDSINDLPAGAGPITLLKDYGDTAALMLTIASPKVGELEIALRAKEVEKAITEVRGRSKASDLGPRFTLLVGFPLAINPRLVQGPVDQFIRLLQQEGVAQDIHFVEGPGFMGLDAASHWSDDRIMAFVDEFIQEYLLMAEIPPDIWRPVLIRDPAETATQMAKHSGDKYSYQQLDHYTKLVERTLLNVGAYLDRPPMVSKVSRYGVLPEEIFLKYSQERVASYGLNISKLPGLLQARNIAVPGGIMEAAGRKVAVQPLGEFKSEQEIGQVIVAVTSQGVPVYLGDLVQVVRSYESPPNFLNFFSWRDTQGKWQRSRAITVAVQMRSGEKIGDFAQEIEATLADLRQLLPEDLIIARTSDQPRQVKESIDLFMKSLYEAIFLVVLVAWIGFWEWRSALLMAFSIPLTLAMTFGFMHLVGIDLQQVAIASLIIALGLLVDDPVVAGDAIKQELGRGVDPQVAAWLGPTKLASPILFATITNIVAYLPYLTVSGDSGRFIFSLPIVLTFALIASRLVSMTFIPFLGYYTLKPPHTLPLPLHERRQRGFTATYYKIGNLAITHRWRFLLCSLAFLALGVYAMYRLPTAFFPKDLMYLSYVDVWLPEDAPLSSTNMITHQTENIIREVATRYGEDHPGQDGKSRQVLESLTSFVGGGGPRFWFSLSPEPRQLNYAQIVIQLRDKQDTGHLVERLQHALSTTVPGARFNVKQLETGVVIKNPVSVRLSGEDEWTLRNLSEQVKQIYRRIPQAERIQDNWGTGNMVANLKIDANRANLAGVTNLDVALASAGGISGYQVATLREGDKQIPIKVRLGMEERSRLEDLQNLYVYSSEGDQKIPLGQISSIDYSMHSENIKRRQQFRTIEVSCFPKSGFHPSEVLSTARLDLLKFAKTLPPGYKLEIGGEEEQQKQGFRDLTIVLLISVTAIYIALVFQFQNAIKPLVVFATIPYGMTGALIALRVMGQPFGFMAFLGIVSLVGVIVSHIIVLFDFIEEKHQEGEPLQEAVLDAGIIRLRPVLIAVGSTVFGLLPLALHGGPLWEPLCYAQIGGLLVATFITLLLVPVIYSIFVLDLKWVSWDPPTSEKLTQRHH